MKVKYMFSYDENTHEYRGEVPTTLDPKASEQAHDDIWLIPANSTEFDPNGNNTVIQGQTLSMVRNEDGSLKDTYVYVFNKDKNCWEVKRDYRKSEIYLASDKIVSNYDKIGDLPKGYFLLSDLPYKQEILRFFDYKDDSWIIDSMKAEVLTFITRYRKSIRDINISANIEVNGVQYKADESSCADYMRVITLDTSTDFWVDASGNTNHMDKVLANTILLKIQERKEEQVISCADAIKYDSTANDDYLINMLKKIYGFN